uniref:Uncharacterized protein n=1 Tax=Panagrolaimus davidi TaxID=227884 RepID=A0A914PVT8_9BILA
MESAVNKAHQHLYVCINAALAEEEFIPASPESVLQKLFIYQHLLKDINEALEVFERKNSEWYDSINKTVNTHYDFFMKNMSIYYALKKKINTFRQDAEIAMAYLIQLHGSVACSIKSLLEQENEKAEIFIATATVTVPAITSPDPSVIAEKQSSSAEVEQFHVTQSATNLHSPNSTPVKISADDPPPLATQHKYVDSFSLNGYQSHASAPSSSSTPHSNKDSDIQSDDVSLCSNTINIHETPSSLNHVKLNSSADIVYPFDIPQINVQSQSTINSTVLNQPDIPSFPSAQSNKMRSAHQPKKPCFSSSLPSGGGRLPKSPLAIKRCMKYFNKAQQFFQKLLTQKSRWKFNECTTPCRADPSCLTKVPRGSKLSKHHTDAIIFHELSKQPMKAVVKNYDETSSPLLPPSLCCRSVRKSQEEFPAYQFSHEIYPEKPLRDKPGQTVHIKATSCNQLVSRLGCQS